MLKNNVKNIFLSAFLCGAILLFPIQAFADVQSGNWYTVTGSNTSSYSTQAILPVNLVPKFKPIALPDVGDIFTTISNGVLYAVDNTQQSKMYATSLATNTVKWEFNVDPTLSINQIIAMDGMVYVMTGTKLYALKDEGGSYTLKWSISASHIGQITYDASKIYYRITDADLKPIEVVLDAVSGVEQKRFPIGNRGEAPGRISAGGGRLYFIANDAANNAYKNLCAVDETTGQILWKNRYFINNVLSAFSPAYMNGKLLMDFQTTVNNVTKYQILSFDAATGKSLWTYTLSSAFAHTGNTNLFTASQNSVITIGQDGYMVAINSLNGTELWKKQYADILNIAGKKVVTSSNGLLIAAGDKIILGNNDKIKMFDIATGTILNVISPGDKNYYPIAVADNTLLLTNGVEQILYAPAAPGSDTVKPMVYTENNNQIRFSPIDGDSPGIFGLKFDYSKQSNVRFDVINSDQKTVRHIDMGLQQAGWSTFDWNGKDDLGKPVPFGKYHFGVYLKDLAGNENYCNLTGKIITAGDVWGKAVTNSNVRIGPGTQYRIVNTLTTGQKVRINDDSGSWYNVLFDTPDGPHTGYVAKSLISTYSIPATNQGSTVTPVKYTVVSGDTLSKIAVKYNVSVTDIVNLNKITNVDSIYVGQQLLIPVPVK